MWCCCNITHNVSVVTSDWSCMQYSSSVIRRYFNWQSQCKDNVIMWPSHKWYKMTFWNSCNKNVLLTSKVSTELLCLSFEKNKKYKIGSAVTSKLTGLPHYPLRTPNVHTSVGPLHLRKVKQQKRKPLHIQIKTIFFIYLISLELSVFFKYFPMLIFWPQPWLYQVVFLIMIFRQLTPWI